MDSAQQIINRSQRLQPPPFGATQRSRNVDYPPSATSVVGVLLAIEDGKLRWRRIRYKHKPPQISAPDAVEAYGATEDGYPIEGGTIEAYAPFVYTGMQEDVVGMDAVPMDCAPRGGLWILQPCMKITELVVPAGEQLPGCSYG